MGALDEPDDLVQKEEALPPSSAVSFLHAVGQSTIRQGLAVPVIAQIDWLATIQKGQAIPITILFDDGASVAATLRRINNARGHLQLRYESKKQAALRDFLAQVFGSTNCANGVLRVSQIEPRIFLFEPVSVGGRTLATLSLYNPHYHNCTGFKAGCSIEFTELQQCLTEVSYNEEYSQNHYNREIASVLIRMGWKNEKRILDAYIPR